MMTAAEHSLFSFAGLRQLRQRLVGGQGKRKSHELIEDIPAGMPRGAYLHGGVGCGKSLVMQIFHKESSVVGTATVQAAIQG